jgi:hypothetical protein
MMEKESKQQAKDEEPVTEGETHGIPNLVGVSRKQNDAFRELVGQTQTEKTDHKAQTKSMQEAIDKQMVRKADHLALAIHKKKRPLTDTEVASMLLRKGELSNEIELILIRKQNAEDAGDTELVDELDSDLMDTLDIAETLTSAIPQGLSENARGLAAAAIMMDRRSFDLVSVSTLAKARAGRKLTKPELKVFEDLSTELKKQGETTAKLVEEIEKRKGDITRKDAEAFILEAISEAKTGRKVTNAKELRKKAKANLKSLGYRMNDITGLPFEVAKNISDIAVSYIQEGATTLDQVVAKIKSDMPDVSNKNVYDALGGRVKKNAKKILDDLDTLVADIKSQAKLRGQIEDSINGIFDPVSTKEPSSAEVKALKAKLHQYSALVVNTESDSAKVDIILERVAEIDKLIDDKVRPLKIKRKKSTDLIEAEKMLATAGAELSAQDQIALLGEIVRLGESTPKRRGEQVEETQRLEEFRADIAILKETIAERAKTKKADEKATLNAEKKRADLELTTMEIEKAFRRIRGSKLNGKPAEARKGDEKIIRERQDKIFGLIDEINNGKPQKDQVKKVEVEDSAGYLAMIHNLDLELKAKKAGEAKKRADAAFEKRVNQKAAELTKEVEGFYRNIRTKTKGNQRQDIKTSQQGKRDQDAIADLLEIIRNKKVPAGKRAKSKEDPFGYVQTTQNLREEIKNSEWNIDAKEQASQIKALEMSKIEIADMERRIRSGDFEGFISPKKIDAIKSDELVRSKLREHQLKKELNQRISDLEPKTWKTYAKNVYDVFREAKLTADLGHIYRQGAFFMSNPRTINPFEYIKLSIDALISQDKADAIDLSVIEDKHYQEGQLNGLRIISEGMELDGREEIIMKSVLGKVPIIGTISKASARTQIASLNWIRQKAYSQYRNKRPDANAAEMKEVASYVNMMTGYIGGKVIGGISHYSDYVLTSTNFTASRFMAPFALPRYWKTPALRKQVIEDTMWFWGWRLMLMGLAVKALPDDVDLGLNPDNHTFGKIVVQLDNGLSRVYDPWAGIQQVMRSARKMSKGQPLKELFSDIGNRAHPGISAMDNIMHKKKYPNQDISRTQAIISAFLPISVENIYETIQNDTGMADLIISSLTDIVGLSSYVIETKDVRGKMRFRDRDK